MIRTTVAIVLLVASNAHAWGGKEHVQLTRIAAQRLLADAQTPPAMKAWLADIVPHKLDEAGERDYLLHAKVQTDLNRAGGGVLYWVMVPDEHLRSEPQRCGLPFLGFALPPAHHAL